MRSALFAAVALSVVVAGCNRTQQETESAATTPAPAPPSPAVAEANATNAPELAAPNTAAGFVSRAALSDMYEIESSRLALERSQSNAVRAYAQMMIDAHTATTREIAAAIAQQNLQITPPTSIDRAGSDRLADLRGASVEDFDDRYIDQQTASHEQALALMRDYAANGDNSAFRTLAGRTAGIVEGHLRMVRELDGGTADDESGADAPTATTGAAGEARNDGDLNPAR